MIDFKKYAGVASSKKSSGDPALSMLRGTNSYKFTLNRPLVEELQLAKRVRKDGKGNDAVDIRVMFGNGEIVIGSSLCEGAGEFEARFFAGSGKVRFYSSPLAKAVEKSTGHQVLENKTVRFESIKIDAVEDGSPAAVISCKN